LAIVLFCVALVAGVPLLSYVIFLRENIRAGLLPRVRSLCGGHLLCPLLQATWNSAWSIALVCLAYPLGWLPRRRPKPCAATGLSPVILIHGLYHNASAWFFYRHRLRHAGFQDVRIYSYASFFRTFESIVEGLVRAVQQAAQDAPEGRVLLVGHSLGGLVIRSACAHPSMQGKVAGVITMGTPHQGSTLAGLIALGGLGRGLRPGGAVLDYLRGLPACVGPALSIYSPTDSMVLPLSGLLLEERERDSGWEERCVPPVSHVGMLYDRRVFELGAEFLLRAASCPASQGAWP
jgi:pimeloyl-ACP methyl ester carboxylesterase